MIITLRNVNFEADVDVLAGLLRLTTTETVTAESLYEFENKKQPEGKIRNRMIT